MRSSDKGYQHPFGGTTPKYVERAAADADRPPIERRRIVEDLKTKFDTINRRAIQCGTAWLTSIPGDMVVTVEALPSSTFPAELRHRGYQLRPEDRGERILASAITERFGRAADGTLVPITEGSTVRVVQRLAHAGIVEVRFSFLL